MKPAQLKYHVLADSLRSLATTLAPGERMPSVPELVREHGVATSTAKAAVEALRTEGLVVRRRGSGTFVADQSRPTALAPLPRVRVKEGTLAVLALYSVPFFRHFVDHITAHASEHGIGVMCRYNHGEMTLGDALSLEAMDPSGFLIVGWELEWVAKELINRGHRVVLFGEPPSDGFASVPTVYGNSEHAGYLATRHLLSRGHRRLLTVHGFDTNEELFGRRRWQGHLRALREAGIDASVLPVLAQPHPTRWHEKLGALQDLFASSEAPTGVIAWSDRDAVGVMTALSQIGKQVPTDVSLVGFGNLPAGLSTNPPLDTIDPHLDVQIQHAFSLLSAPDRETSAVPTALVTPTLVCRTSSTPPGAVTANL